MAILLFLLGIIAVNGRSILQYTTNQVVLTYQDQIKDYYFNAGNPDNTKGLTGPYDEFLTTDCKSLQNDGNTKTGCKVSAVANEAEQQTWGLSSTDDGRGMVGNFYATDIDTGSYTFYQVTKLEISFTGGCLQDMDSIAKDSYIYYTKGGVSIANTQQLSAEKVSGVTTYSLTVDEKDYIELFSGESIGFNIQTNKYCEGNIQVTEFVLEGIGITTVDPTASPSKEPSPAPTTGQPTMAPTSQCKGQVTWGDPHFRMMAFDNDAVTQFNYQELGWFYYIAPCDLSQFEHFPFFLLSEHVRCYWKGNKKGCIHTNKLVLNTKPDPIIITFNNRDLEIEIPDDIFKAEVSDNALKGNGQINTNSNYKDKDGKRLEIVYDDNAGLPKGQTPPDGDVVQSGTLKLFYEGDVIVIQLHDVEYDSLPRKCNKNTKKDAECGKNWCKDVSIDIRNQGTWTYFGCPHCLRNIACGLMGKYYRGDCTQSQLYDPKDRCSKILVGADGDIKTDSNGRAKGDDTFAEMADTWREDRVEGYVLAEGYTINFGLFDTQGLYARDKEAIFKHEKRSFPEGRSLDITDASYYDGYCQNNMTHIKIVNETCRQETVVKYDKCCKEIGLCKILWLTCIEDYCSCTEPATVDNPKPDNITDAWCLKTIIQDSMNATCSVDALWPTATPTAAPTPSPTGLVAGLPQGQKAQDLIWLYLIFVVLFVVIAGVAYWYYRKKNGGKASFQDDVETGVPNTGVGY